MRNARKAVNYEIGLAPRGAAGQLERQLALVSGISFDLTTDEGRDAAAEWARKNPGPVIPDNWDGSKIPMMEVENGDEA